MKAIQRIVAMSLVLLMTAAASGTPTRVTMNTGRDSNPHWDPTAGGNRIVYLRDISGAGMVNSNGTDEAGIIVSGVAQTDDAFAWVGSHFLYGDAAGLHQVYDYSVSAFPVITEIFSFQSGVTHVGPVASRGQTVIWRVGWNSGTKTELHVDTYSNLVSSASQRAQDAGTVVLTRSDTQIGVRGMSLLPDGRSAVMSLPNGSIGGWDIFLIDTDPTNGLAAPAEITTTGRTTGLLNWFPEVSPNGSQILFGRKNGAIAAEKTDLFLMNINGSGLVNLTNSPGVEENCPTWSPNGQDYAFQRFDTGLPGESDNWNIYVDQTPEPATMTLLAIGGLAILRKRRK